MEYGRPDSDVKGDITLEHALAVDCFLGPLFKKRGSHPITYKSGNTAKQIHFILFRRTMRKLVTDVKVIPGEEVDLQHQLLVCDIRINVPPKSKRMFTARLKIWKLKDSLTSYHFQEVFNLYVSASASVADAATEDIRNNIKTGLLKTTEDICGTTRPTVGVGKPRSGTSTWNSPLLPSVKLSRHERLIKPIGHHTMQPNALPDMQCIMLFKKPTRKSTRIFTPSSEVYRLANHLRRENADVVCDKPVKNGAGEMSMSKDSKQKSWLELYQMLLSVEFDRDQDYLCDEPPVEGPPIPVTTDMVQKVVSQMKAGKPPGPSGIVVEMIREAGDTGASMTSRSFTMARYPPTGSRVSLSALQG